MKKISFIILLYFCAFMLNAQEDSFRETFIEANTLMLESQYDEALKKWLELYELKPDNHNINFKIGKCYIYSANNKKKALDYLIKAAQNTTGNYDPFFSNEKKAPLETYYFLGRAYHINYELDNAMSKYYTFKDQVSKGHYLYDDIDHQIEQCKNAKIAIANPSNISVENLGNVINSVYADYSPVMSIDESTIYYTSRRIRPDSTNVYLIDDSDGKYFEDIYVSNNYNGQWSTPKMLNINTERHDAIVNISADGQMLFIYRDDNSDGNIYTSKLEGEDNWSFPEKLGSDINLNSRETHAHTSPDGNILYFVSDRKKGFGGQDIYQCKKLPNGEWAKAQNIGDVINTPYDEDGIFIHPSGKTMYFSSRGHASIGGYDIFYSNMDDDGNWGPPVNMRYPVNTTDDDVFFVTSADGKRGYYSSFQEKGYGEKDIYRISLASTSAQPLTLLTGFMKITDQENLPEDALIVVLDKETEEVVGRYTPRKKDGKFSIILPPERDYHIVYSAAEYQQEEDLFVPSVSAYQEISRGIELGNIVFSESDNNNNNVASNDDPVQETVEIVTGTPTNNVRNIGNVLAEFTQYFNYSKKNINTADPEYIKLLNNAVNLVNISGKVYIDIESSASKVPSSRNVSNIELARNRAISAKERIIKSLVAEGLNKSDIIINDIKSEIGGPEYKNNPKDKIYEKYQYVIIKIR